MSLSLRRTLYARFDDRMSIVTDFKTGSVSRVRPVVAVGGHGDGRHVVAVGEEALHRHDCELFQPFSHERIIVADFEAAQALLRYPIMQAMGRRVMIKPRVILHPLRPIAAALTDVEVRALLELALSVSASWAAVYVGAELSAETYTKTSFPWSADSWYR
jgi:actin-like ATPase involved in cell morphogenesis